MAGLGVAVAGCAASTPLLSPAAATAPPAGSGLTAIAAVDDAVRLARHDVRASETTRRVLGQNVNLESPGNVALTASGLRVAPEAVVGMIARYRDGRPHDDAEAADLRLAFALGWLAHRAARAGLAPAYAGAAPDPAERAAYHDAAVLRGRSASAAPGGAVDPVERLFQEFGGRMLTRFHTLNPDYDDVPGWVGRLADRRRERFAFLARLARAYQAPDPDKQRRYVTDPNVYDPDDVAVRAARALQAGTAATVDPAVSEADGPSLYARAVGRGYANLMAADAVLRGDASAGDLVAAVR